jgi:hypothetical protein
VTDTELQIAQFVLPRHGFGVTNETVEARTLRAFKEELPEDHVSHGRATAMWTLSHICSGSQWNTMVEGKTRIIIMSSERESSVFAEA